MEASSWQLFSTFGIFVALVMICGVYCIMVTQSLLRAIIGIELLMKAVTLLFVIAGYITGRTALTQAFVITVIVIEVVVTVVAAGVALQVFRHNDDLDARRLRNLKG
jgi:multisubunit Na+/H+ antiporter MnhC subunit